ncbi:hypothetical protein FRC10_006365 [Ceratobasidium sp. 414]|nr:hypothetical protein FRC10_006365 [Ceratobasidium sp. 414]
MPRKKAGGTLKRSSSDGPGLDDTGSGPKRPRTDASTTTTSHITLGAPAHKARKPVTYMSKTRKNRLSGGSPPKLTSFGFNVENRPKVNHTLFHLSPSPRTKSKSKAKLFASPKINGRRRSKAGTSMDNSKVDISADEDEQEEGEEERRVPSPGPSNLLTASTPPRPSNVNTALGEHDEHDDRPTPLPFLSPVKPIEGPGLEIRTPLQGRTVPASIQSLSKRTRTDVPSIPLFAATPRPVPPQIPDLRLDGSPGKSHAAPIFAPTPAPVPSTPVTKSKLAPSFAPSAPRPTSIAQDDGSPTKKPAPVFGPTPARAPPSLRTNHDTNAVPRPVFAPESVKTPGHHAQSLPALPPPLPTTSSSVPETSIPETPTARWRTPPTSTPGQLFPLPDQPSSSNQKAKVSRAPTFGVLEEGEESTPRAGKDGLFSREIEAGVKEGEDDGEGEGDLSMADVFNASIGPPESVLDLPEEVNPAGPPTSMNEQTAPTSADTLGPLVSLNEPVIAEEPTTLIATNASLVITRSRSRSRSASASASGSVLPQGTVKTGSRAGSVSSQACSVSLSRANSVLAPSRTKSRRGSNISLSPLVTDPATLSRVSSLDQFNPNLLDHLRYRISQTAAGMVDTSTPGDETPSASPDIGGEHVDEGNLSTSPLSSLPEDMSLDMLDVRDRVDDSTTRDGDGDNTLRNEDTTIRDHDRSTVVRDPVRTVFSSPFSLPAPTSPVSSVPGDTGMDEDIEVDVVGFSSPPRPAPDSAPSPCASSSSLTSLDEDTEAESEEEKEGQAPAKSMIPVAKRPGPLGTGTVAQTPSARVPPKRQNGVTPRPNKPDSTRNGATPGPTRPELGKNGATPALVKVGISRTAPTPIRPPIGLLARPFPAPASAVESSTGASGTDKSTAKPRTATRARAGVGRVMRSLAAPTASTAAKTRAKVVTAPPPPRARITNFMKPNAPVHPMPPPAGLGPAFELGSASPRKGMSKDDSDIRGPRRSTISDDTQASLSSLSNALEKLARPSLGSGNTRPGELPPRPGTSMGFAEPARPGLGGTVAHPPHIIGGAKRSAEPGAGASGKWLKSSIGPGASKPTGAIATAPSKGKGKAKDGDAGQNEDDADYEVSKKGKANDDLDGPLRSCVIFVDVRTAEGEDAGSLFIDMLRELGAKVVSKPTPSTTHFVFKSGHQSTLTKHKLYDDPQPFLVGIGWVVECVEKRERVNEERFAIKTDEVSALDLREVRFNLLLSTILPYSDLLQRRKSQLPHRMQFMVRDPNPTGAKFGTTSAEAAAVARCTLAEVEQDAEVATERSKKRAQQKLFPKVDRSPT